jgi:hypothetical protein
MCITGLGVAALPFRQGVQGKARNESTNPAFQQKGVPSKRLKEKPALQFLTDTATPYNATPPCKASGQNQFMPPHDASPLSSWHILHLHHR